MHFRILKLIATSDIVTALECTNFFLLGLCPGPHWGRLQRSPNSLAGLRGPTSNEKEGQGEEGRGRERDCS